MSLWSSFRRFTRAKKTEDGDTNASGSPSRSSSLPSLKHRGLRLEQFEQRLLLSITPNQAYLDDAYLDVTDAWATATGAGVVVAVLDDGIDAGHPDLTAYDPALSYDFMTGTSGTGGPVLDTDNHGTAIAGIIASDNSAPSTGVAYDATLASYRLTSLDPDTPLDSARIAAALTHGLGNVDIYNVGFNYAAELYHPGADVLGAMRMGVTEGRSGLGNVYVYGAGASGGNSNYDALINSRYSIAVGAVDVNGNVISAPGTATLVSGFAGVNDILTTDRVGTDGYDAGDYTLTDDEGFGGSQAAAAQISGVIAMMLEANPSLTYREVQQILVENSSNWGAPYDQDGLGWGTVNAQAAVEAAASWSQPVMPEASAVSGPLSSFTLIDLDGNLATFDDNYVESSVDISAGVGSIEWVEVTLYGLPDDWAGNEVKLISPSGVESFLTRAGSATSDGSSLASGWTFTSAAHWGEASGGNWTLQLSNAASGQIGTWAGWDLKVYGKANPSSLVAPELVKIIPNAGGELEDGDTLGVAPRELLFQFNEQQDLDDATFGAIQIANANGMPIQYKVLPGDKTNQVVMRFAETLPDGAYTITIKGAGALPLENIDGVVFNNGLDLNIDFNLDLGAQVVSVVPQPVYRDGFSVTVTDLTPAEDGQTFTVSDGFNTVTFELNDDTGTVSNPDHVAIDLDFTTTPILAANAALLIAAAIDAEFDDDLLTVTPAGDVVTVTGSQAQVTAGAGATALNVQSIRTLAQATNKIDVYFNDDDLDPAAATNPTFYRLHLLNASGVSIATRIPDKVVYSAEDDKAQLIFNTPIALGTYHLEIGATQEGNDALSSAVNAGTLWAGASSAGFEGYIGDTSGGTGDVDLYRFVAGASGVVNVTLTGGFVSELLDSAGNPTSTNVVAGETYFVRVSSPTAGSYQLGLTVTGALNIQSQNSSYATATNLGTLGAAATLITGQNIGLSGATILDQPGSQDEPGHRHILADVEHVSGGGSYGSIRSYNFAPNYGWTTPNQITEAQKERTREIFEILGSYLGVQFRETASSGIQIVTGDLRAAVPNIPTGAVAGLGGPGGIIINAAMDWGESEYGGGWFNVALHEIGHAMSLGHAYDIPATMGAGGGEAGTGGLGTEAVYPEDNDLIHLQYLWNTVWNEIDLYKFEATETGTFTAETIAERLGPTSYLDTQLVLYREVNVDGQDVREVIARNDDYFSNDSLIQLDLEPGTYYVGVMSSGLADVDPTIPNSGFGGRSTGNYQLSLGFEAQQPTALVDATGTALDGDADGVAGGVFDFWFEAGDDTNTVFVDKETGSSTGPGTLASPYSEIDNALVAATPGAKIVRVVGNGNDTPYLVGYDNTGNTLADGSLVQLPADVTLMIDAGAIFKLQDANIEVGSSAQGISLAGAALQVLGTPFEQVHFRSFRDDSIGGDTDGSSSGESGGDWGGLVFRADSDYEQSGIFLNWVGWADIQHGGGKVTVGTVEDNYTSIHTIGARPTIVFSTIQHGSGGAISADLLSFEETYFGPSARRIGPEIHGNTVLDNSVNGLFVRIPTQFGSVVERLEVSARWDDTDIIHVVTENLFIHGTPGGPLSTTARLDGRLRIDPGAVVKVEGARIHTEIAGQLIAEGLPGYPVVFTSLKDDNYGLGRNYDTSNNGIASLPAPGDWGGLIFAPTSHGSLDYMQLSYAGGQTSFEGAFDRFNAIEIHQADVRIANSVIENNANGNSNTNRGGLGTNTAATIFVRGAQPVILGNTIIDNSGDAITINANALNYDIVDDPGRSTGRIEAFAGFGDNHGPLIRLNTLDNTPGGGNQLNGMAVRGGFLTAESTWDDTDIVHVLRDQINIGNLHTLGGLRLQSTHDASLVVKLDGASAGFTANGEALDIEDRIGGTLQILGTENYPVILTSLHDDSAAAGFNLDGKPQGNTDAVSVQPGAGDWDSIVIDRFANARNVAIVNETESVYRASGAISGMNDLPMTAQFLGYLAPDLDPSLNVAAGGQTIQGVTDDEKGGDENRRLGFEVQGTISLNDPTDRDIYSFSATAGSEVWIDLDRTSFALDAKVELVLLDGTVVASSTNNSSFTGSTSVNSSAGTSVFGTATMNLQQDAYLGDDFYGTNPLDPGMHVVLPGTAGTTGTYFVRVSSEGNLTSGRYQMQLRLRQVDEEPGSTIRYADIRYATNGIEVYGHPAHSILAAEAGERSGDNNSRDGAQNLGNLLESDLNTIGVSGNISSASDVDWYRFEINQEQIQSIGGVNNGGKTFATMFDIDYADGISRANTVLSVYDGSGNLILVSYDSNVEDDQSAVGEGLDRDDLSRGSFDSRDPYIGSVHMPSGGVGGTTTYYVAVSSNRLLPTELNQAFQSNATNPDIRVEPVDSVQRVVEDHIGFNGYTTGNSDGSTHINPIESNGILDISSGVSLRSHVVPYTFADVVLFVSSGGGDELRTVNPFTGVAMVDVGRMNSNNGMDDIAMRADGTLMGHQNGTNDGNSGVLRTIDTGTAGFSGGGDDGLATVGNFGQDFGGMAFRDMGTTTWEIYAVNNSSYDMVNDTPTNFNDGVPALWRIDSGGGAVDENTNQNAPGRQPVGNLAGISGRVTGLEFIDNTLYAVDDDGYLYRTTVSGSGGGSRSHSGWTQVANLGPVFTGLTLGPQNLDVINSLDSDGDGFPDETPDGSYSLTNVLFASSSNRLYAFTTSGIPVVVFDSDGDGVADASDIGVSGTSSITGLAFSPLDLNLWHPTERRRTDTGHGVNQAFDNSRGNNFSQNYPVSVNQDGQQVGAVSFYFGLESWVQNPNNNEYERYGLNAQYGFATSENHQDLTSNSAIGNNYNTPGGAHGSLITDTFSLEGAVYADKPTLYVNYFLDTEGERWDSGSDPMFDSARIWVGVNTPGTSEYTWQLLATNNSALSSNSRLNELPKFLSTSSDASSHTRQRTQELFDAADWRQARVDLGDFAGLSNLKLRFDFSTSGRLPTHNTGLDGTVEDDGSLTDDQGVQNNNFEGFYIDDIIIGYAERGEMVTAANGTLSHFTLPAQNLETFDPVEQLTGAYQLEIRRGTEYANNVTADTGAIALVHQFDTNARLVPDGGDWAWSWNAGVQDWDQTWVPFPTHHYLGNYVGNYRGDQNIQRQQDQLIIQANTIRDVEVSGIVIDTGNRDGLDVPQPGSPINFPVLNGSDLAPGVVVTNNVVAGFGDTGIFFSGDSDQSVNPIVPFGRIVNNTVVGTSPAISDYGIRVTEYASPTILNNIIASTNRGILIDGTSGSSVANYNLFKNVTTNGSTAAFNIDLDVQAPTDPLFVNALLYNFYLADGTLAIDSSIDVLGERSALAAVKSPLVIPVSPIIAPERDRYNQLRLDDPDQSPPSGMGANIYKDRGAIERADFTGPTSRIIDPLDNQIPRDNLHPKLDGAYDYDPTNNDVIVYDQKTLGFAIQLYDTGGIGIDDLSIQVSATDPTARPDVVTVYRAPSLNVFNVLPQSRWPKLTLGTDYLLEYDSVNDILHVLPASGVWETNTTYVIDFDNAGVLDKAGNPLQPNRSSAPYTGRTLFTVQLAGLDYGDLPDGGIDPAVPNYATLLASGTQGGARHVLTGTAYLGSMPDVDLDGQPTVDASGDLYDDGVVVTSALLMNSSTGELAITASQTGYLNAWIDFNGDGDVADPGERLANDLFIDPSVDPTYFLQVTVPDEDTVRRAATATPDVDDVDYNRFARFRFTSRPFNDFAWLKNGGANGFSGLAYDGEVEDYMFTIVEFPQDWGDAPSGPFTSDYFYPTIALDNGATHYITGPYLGASIDSELDGQPTLTAGGDGSDDDGITFLTEIMPGEEASIEVTVTDRTVDTALYAWIDFDRNGMWDSTEQLWGGGVLLTADTETLTFTVPETAAPGSSFARFRLSTDLNLEPTGLALDGEVEDYQVIIESMDYGDSPFQTLRADDGPRHVITGPSLGVLVDHDMDGQPTAGADGDDFDADSLANGNDEDDVVFVAPIIPGEDAVFNVYVAGTGHVYAWLDLDGSQVFDPVGELVIDTSVASPTGVSGPQTLSFTVPQDVTPGETVLRFRVVDAAAAWTPSPTGLALSGEVEDYLVTIHDVDYGDAIDDYGTLRISDGARHVLGGPVLGALVDHDQDGEPSLGADGDDLLDGNDDEDGVIIPENLIPGYLAPFDVTVSLPGWLDVWIDFDQNLVFDSSEHIVSQLVDGVDPVMIQIAENALPGDTFARFRITTDGLDATGAPLGPNGLALSGEVEDYLITINEVDFGDAPDPIYPTTPPAGASHMIAGPILGTLVDHDAQAHQSPDAMGDDIETTDPAGHNGDDEDGITFLDLSDNPFAGLPGLIPGETYSIDVTVTNEDGAVFGWIDFDGDGVWSASEMVVSTTAGPSTSETVRVSFAVPHDIDPIGSIFARFRVVSEADALVWTPVPTGAIFSGEVEDYQLEILPLDYGDADKPVTEFANNGARHVITDTGPYLGTSPADWERDGIRSPLADADDNAGDDEGGPFVLDWWGNNDSLNVIPGEMALLRVPVNGADGTVYGWVDWNKDGDYTDSGEFLGSATVVAGNYYDFPVMVPLTDPGAYDIRLRVTSSATPLQSFGLALDGEVEDHQLNVVEVDYGDLPNTAENLGSPMTEHADNGARHVIMGPYLGTTATDWENDGQPDAGALGDDDNGSDDEDGVALSYALNANVDGSLLASDQLVPGEWVSLNVTVNGTAGEIAYVYGWIDFDGDGQWNDNGLENHSTTGANSWDEFVVPGVAVTVGAPLSVDVFVPRYDMSGAPIAAGEIFARFRVISEDEYINWGGATWAGLTPEGLAYTGEVEDYRFEVVDVDYGDAPDNADSALPPSYSTLWSEDGARHIARGPYLGTQPDGDPDGQVLVTDDGDGNDDEDGISFDTLLVPGEQATITVTASAAAKLDAWFDFDASGTFDAGEQLLGGTIDVTGSVQLTFDVPVDAVPGYTYARFRLSTAGGLSPSGLAQDGEVEDYQILISGVDFGDAPDTYGTLRESNGPRHVISEPSLGSLGDHEQNGLPSPGADGDDLDDAANDEDGVTLTTVIGSDMLIPGEWATFTIDLQGSASADVHGWLDLNGDGNWDAGEDFLHLVDVSGQQVFDYWVPKTAVPGATIGRFRVVDHAEGWTPSPWGLAQSGEVEDHLYTIRSVDYGDAPISYATYLVSGGAHHVIDLSGPYLGADVDHDFDGAPSSGAIGDDLFDSRDDEDGVTFSHLLWIDNPATQQASYEVVAPNGGFVDVWIDFNGDGDWDDAGEHLQQRELTSNPQTFYFDVPNTGYAGHTYARVRITSDGLDAQGGALTPYGLAADGEVEDYWLFLNPIPIADAGGPYWINNNEPLDLDASSSVADDPAFNIINSPDSIVAYEWDFTYDPSVTDPGDERSSFNPEFVTGNAIDSIPWPWFDIINVPEPENGALTIYLRVIDAFGAVSEIVSTDLRIFENQPVAEFTVTGQYGPSPFQPTEQLTFDGTLSTHDRDVATPPGMGYLAREIVKYEWDFNGDGIYDFSQQKVFGDPDPVDFGKATHSYATYGQYTAVLRVTDSNVPAKTDIFSLTVNVTAGNTAPQADAGGPYTVNIGAPLSLDGSGSTYDTGTQLPWGDSIVSWQWDLNGDGNFDAVGQNPTVAWIDLDLLGLSPTAGDGSKSTPVKLRVTDSLGLSNEATTTLTVHENMPHAIAVTTPSSLDAIEYGQSIFFDATGSWHDRDDIRDIVRYEWNFGDGSPLLVQTTGAAGFGTASHAYAKFGRYTATLRVYDNNTPARFDTLQFNITVNATDQLPVAIHGGPYTVTYGNSVVLSAGNSYDPEDLNHGDAGDAVTKYVWTLTDSQSNTLWTDETTLPGYTLPWNVLNALNLQPGTDYPLSLQVWDKEIPGVVTSDPSAVVQTTLQVPDDEVTVDLVIANDGPVSDNVIACNFNAEFEATAQNLYGYAISTYEWDFDYDGVTFIPAAVANSSVAFHRFTQFGTYDVAVRVTDANGQSALAVIQVDVSEGSVDPIADAGGPSTYLNSPAYFIDLTEDLTLDGSGSYDPDEACGDSIVSYMWDLDNDGQYDDASGASPTIAWNDLATMGVGTLGVHVIGLQVTDEFGGTGTAAGQFVVFENVPTAVITISPNDTTIGRTDTVDFDGTSSMPGRPDRQIVKYEWDFNGDGTYEEVQDDPQAANFGKFDDVPFNLFQTYTVSLRVTDNNSPAKTDATTIDIEVSEGNQAPQAVLSVPSQILFGEGIVLDGIDSSDPDIPYGDSIVSYAWTIGGHDPLMNTPILNLTWSDLTGLGIATDGTPVEVTLTVTDEYQNTDTATAYFTVESEILTALFTATPNPVACNTDVDFDGSGSSLTGGTITKFEWDFNYDGTTFDVDAEGETTNHSYSQFGDYPVALRVTGSNMESATSVLTVVVSLGNLAPQADAGGPYTFTVGEAIVLNGGGSTDPNEDCGDFIAAYEWDLDYDGTNFDVDRTGATINLSAGTIPTDTPRQIALRVTDNQEGLTNIDVTTLLVTEMEEPEADAGGPYNATEGTPFVLDGTDSSDDQGIVKYEWDLDYDGTTFDADLTTTAATISHTFNDDVATRTIALRVTDGDDLTDIATTTITVANADPVAGGLSLSSTVTIDGQVLTVAGDSLTVTGTFTDVGTLDTHTVSINWGDGSSSNATVNQAAGTLEAIHTYAATGAFSVVATVTDDDSGSDQATATASVIASLGVVDFRDDLADLDPTAGDLWFELTAAHTALLTVQLQGTGGSVATAMLYDAGGNAVAPLAVALSDGSDFNVTSGADYFLRLSGTAADVDLRLTNLVSVDGSDVNVLGTDQDDVFEFELTSSYFVRINGTQYHIDDVAGVAETVTFDGGLGTDSANFVGSTADESGRFFTGQGEFYSGSETYDGAGFFVNAMAEDLSAHSGGGRDYLKMYDSPGDDTFTSTPTMVSLVGPGYSHEGHGFYMGLGYATNRAGAGNSGGNDQAIMQGSAGYDKFKFDWQDAEQFFAKMYNGTYYARAKNFETTDAQSGGGNDLARVYGSEGDDEFFMSRDTSGATGALFDVDYFGFHNVVAYGGGGYDIVRFEDTAGDDEMRGRAHKTTMYIEGDYNLAARAFDEVHAEAIHGGNDKAKLHDTAGNDILHAAEVGGQTWAQMAIDGTTEDPLYEALAFEFVRAYSLEGGDDKVDRAEEYDWLLLDGPWTDL